MKVTIWLKQLSQPKIYEKVTSTYQKGDLFCIYKIVDNYVVKYPINDIFRIEENYKEDK